MSHLHVQWSLSLSLEKHTQEKNELFVLTIDLDKLKQ